MSCAQSSRNVRDGSDAAGEGAATTVLDARGSGASGRAAVVSEDEAILCPGNPAAKKTDIPRTTPYPIVCVRRTRLDGTNILAKRDSPDKFAKMDEPMGETGTESGDPVTPDHARRGNVSSRHEYRARQRPLRRGTPQRKRQPRKAASLTAYGGSFSARRPPLWECVLPVRQAVSPGAAPAAPEPW